MAWSAAFSALEVVPLALVGFEAFRNLRLLKVSTWAVGYKWAVYFFVAVSFWNVLGAGIFGFLINPPISLFYVQGLNLTPLHGHAALFGVYGMLGIGLMLFCLRSLMPGKEWVDKPIAVGFWGLNIGLLFGWSVRTSGGEQVSGSVFNRLEDREDEADAVGADAAVRE